MHLADVVLLLTAVVASAESFEFDSGLSWSCVKGFCVKNPPDASQTLKKFSHEVCRLVCGTYGPLWPHPTGPTILSTDLALFHPDQITFRYYFNHKKRVANCYLRKVSKMFRKRLINNCRDECAEAPKKVIIFFHVHSSNMVLNWKTNESYQLEINEAEKFVFVTIKSHTVFGARYALETLNQLITMSTIFLDTKWKTGMLMVATAIVTDAPVYKHRGFRLDAARSFFPVKTILRILDGMAMTKLNVFHWTLTNTDSFSVEIPAVPEMSEYGAYSSEKVYYKKDIKKVVRYARLRGIRVILELNLLPYVSNGWQWGPKKNLGSLAVCVARKPDNRYCSEPPCGQLNPVNNNVYSIVKKIMAYFISLVPKGEVFHLGSNYVNYACWNSSKEIVAWMAKNNIATTEEGFYKVYSFSRENILTAFDDANPVKNVPIIIFERWQSLSNSTKYPNTDRYVMQVWSTTDYPAHITFLKQGFKIIMNPIDKWVLPVAKEDWFNENCKNVYNYKLFNHTNVLGGEMLMLSTWIDDYLVDSVIWPKTAAAAERLWSNPTMSYKEAEPRLMHFREALIKRGIRASPIAPYFCYQYEGKCK